MVVALSLFGAVAAAMFRALDRQARFHDGMTRLLESRSQLAASHDAIASSLRSSSTAAAELDVVTDTALQFRSTVASAVACAVSAAGVEAPSEVLSSGHRLTHIRSTPVPGDSLWLFDEGASPSSSDDGWFGVEIASVSRPVGACATSPYVHPILDAASQGWRFTFVGSPLLPPGVGQGSVLRITRRSRFALYRTGTGDYALGYADWNHGTAAWDVIQPVSGAFAPVNRSVPAASGVVFTVFDSTNAPMASGTLAPEAARLTVTTRTRTRGALRMDGLPRGVRSDSLSSTIALRNRR